MPLSVVTSWALSWICSLAWIVTYILALHRGFKDGTYGVPLPAIVANIAWEGLHSTIFANYASDAPIVSAIWFVLDVFILLQALLFRRREFGGISAGTLRLLVYEGLVFCLAGLYFAESNGLAYVGSAFPQNLMMSILFVRMVSVREDARGQSIYIGACKMLGTAAAILATIRSNASLPALYTITFAGILFFDLLYVYVLYRKLTRIGIQPFRRI